MTPEQLIPIPEELKARRQWVVWKTEWRDGKATKVPYNASTGERAKSDDPQTWSSFEEAVRALPDADGIGFVWSENDPYCAIDMDGCRNMETGEIAPWATRWTERFYSYTDLSPSGTGLHVIVWGKWPGSWHVHKIEGAAVVNGKKPQIEVYDRVKYFTVTGIPLAGMPLVIAERQAVLDSLHEEFAPAPKEERKRQPLSLEMDDTDLLEVARNAVNGDRFRRLYDQGDTSGYGGDDSAADLALCNHLAFYCRGDESRMDRMFRASALYRDKWDRKSGEGTYGQLTLRKALANCSLFYTPPPAMRGASNGKIRTEAPATPALSAPSAESLHYTDLGNGRRLVMRHGHNLRHSTTHGWLIWDGRRWKRDDTDEIRRLAADTVRALYGEAGALPDGQREDAAKWAISCESMFRLRAMIDAASFQEEIAISPDALDANPWLMPCLNGTLNLQTAALKAPERSDLITRLCPVEYDAEALCSEFDVFLETIFGGDEALVEFIWRAIGYSLTGDVSEQLLFFLHGGGSNGKSTLLNVLLALLGEYGTTAAPGLLTEQRNDQHPTAIADLAGRRLVVCVETGEGKRLAEEQVKQITSSEPLKARFMRKDFFEFLPTHKLWLAANHRPMVRGTDLAIWRRIPLVPFLVEFKGAEEARPGDHIKDPALFARLKAELPGILARAVQGCLDWQRDGLLWPACVKAASGAYRAEMDVMAVWLAECCTTGDPAVTRQRSGELYASYKLWCEAGGERYMSQTAFGKGLTERGFGQHATPTRYRTGIKLVPIE